MASLGVCPLASSLVISTTQVFSFVPGFCPPPPYGQVFFIEDGIWDIDLHSWFLSLDGPMRWVFSFSFYKGKTEDWGQETAPPDKWGKQKWPTDSKSLGLSCLRASWGKEEGGDCPPASTWDPAGPQEAPGPWPVMLPVLAFSTFT